MISPDHAPRDLTESEMGDLRVQLGLPRKLREPLDLQVPLVAPWSRFDEWVALDGAGSADAAYGLGVAEAQLRHLDSAAALFTRAAERGSADGAFARYVISAAMGTGQEQSWSMLQAADDAGSPEAALQVSQRQREVGDKAGADDAAQRALLRARARDREGSADASWTLSRVEPDETARTAALQRAYERGVAAAASQVGMDAQLSGDAGTAIRALTFAAACGDGWAGLELGDTQAAAGERRVARQAWQAAGRLAVATGDKALDSLARQRLVPPLRSVLGRHKVAAALYLVAMVVCALRIQYALQHREPDRGIAAAMYATLALVVAGLATLLGVWNLL
jgi:hypothetical protein